MTDDTKMKHYRRLKVASGFREFRHHIQQDNRDLKTAASLMSISNVTKRHKKRTEVDFLYSRMLLL